MKPATAMKAMKRAMKAMKVSKLAKGKNARAVVWAGRKEKTKTGLTKSMLVKSKRGKIVTKKSHAAGKKAYSQISGWNKAVSAAKKSLGLTGFVPINGKSAVGKALYAKAKVIYAGA